MNDLSRKQACFAIEKCIKDEIDIFATVSYTSSILYIAIPYLVSATSSILDKRLILYCKEVFGLLDPRSIFNEHKLENDEWVTTHCFKVDENKWQEIQTLLRFKGYGR